MRIDRVGLAILSIGLGALGCKGKAQPPNPTGSAGSAGSAAPAPVIDWVKCESALKKAKTMATFARGQVIIDGCAPCGDPKALLDWTTLPEQGGPTRPAIEQALVACHAFCDPNAKQRFFGALDTSRGTTSRAPWRYLGEMCKEQVSAMPDARLSSAPLLLLDRIGRAIAGHGGDAANALADLDVGVPAVTITSIGPALPTVPGTLATPPAKAVSLIGDDTFTGDLPVGHLGAAGVAVTGDYPGKPATLAQVGTAFEGKAIVLAPLATPARRIVDLVAAAGDGRLYLAADAPGAPEGWILAGAIDIPLRSGGANAIKVTDEMTVENLANELAKRAARHEPAAGLVTK